MTRRGFTLIELLVVIAIIAILAAILFPVFAKAREKARQTTCLNNQRQITAAMLMWVQDHDETFPAASTWLTELTGSYGVTGKVWDCPTSSFKGTEAAPDYFYVGGSLLSSAALGDVSQPSDAPMLADLADSGTNKPYVIHNADATDQLTRAAAIVGTRHNNGAVFAYVDGHTTWLSKENVNAGTFAACVTADSVKWPIDLGTIYKSKAGGPNGWDYYTNTGNLASVVGTYGLTRVAGTGNYQGQTPTGDGWLRSATTTAGGTWNIISAPDPTYLPSWLDKTKSLTSGLVTTGRNIGMVVFGSCFPYGINGQQSYSTTPDTSYTFTLVPTITGAKKIGIIGACAVSSGVPGMNISPITYYTGDTTATPVNKTVDMGSDCTMTFEGYSPTITQSDAQMRVRLIYLKLFANKAITITVNKQTNGSNVSSNNIWLLMEE